MERESRYAGMTTNERLFDAGLLSKWDAAARSRNRERMIELLAKSISAIRRSGSRTRFYRIPENMVSSATVATSPFNSKSPAICELE
jgi:hypothetical protein